MLIRSSLVYNGELEIHPTGPFFRCMETFEHIRSFLFTTFRLLSTGSSLLFLFLLVPHVLTLVVIHPLSGCMNVEGKMLGGSLMPDPLRRHRLSEFLTLN